MGGGEARGRELLGRRPLPRFESRDAYSSSSATSSTFVGFLCSARAISWNCSLSSSPLARTRRASTFGISSARLRWWSTTNLRTAAHDTVKSPRDVVSGIASSAAAAFASSFVTSARISAMLFSLA